MKEDAVLSVDSDSVLHELDGDGVLTLTLNRPERNNAWNVEMERALHDLLFQAAASDEVAVIVLTGAGRSFCPGFDSQSLEQSAGGAPPSAQGRTQLYLPAVIPKPIVCAINGACAGIGLVTALMCDVRFANEDAKLATAFSKRGLPGEEGISWVLPRMIGHGAALELLLSSRPVSGREAVSLGMVHWALPGDELLAAARDYAQDLARTCSPASMATIKRQVYRDWTETLPDARREARHLMMELRTQDDFREGVQSWVEKRPPTFRHHTETLDPADFTLEG
jgi:enoyl-CoA hydratase/carnithine racemase